MGKNILIYTRKWLWLWRHRHPSSDPKINGNAESNREMNLDGRVDVSFAEIAS